MAETQIQRIMSGRKCSEEEAREIAFNELQYYGEEIDTIFKLRYCKEGNPDDEDEEEEDTQ